ncbi:hypothetical protein IC575_011849 [Cucumis melo]
MDQQTLLGVLTAFTLAQRQILLTLELLMNDNRRITYTSSDTRHRIRQLVYFLMIHESDLVCRQSTRMERRTLTILCHLLQTVSGLSLTEIVDVKEMVAMYWACATQKGISFMFSPIGKNRRQTRRFYVMPCHEKMDYKCRRVYLIYNKTTPLSTYLFEALKRVF